MSDVLDLMWGELQDELSKQKAEAEVALSRSERAETTGGILDCAFAVLPYHADGAHDGDLRFVTDACKVGEGVGTGTGTPCYFDEGTNTWLRVEDDAAPLSAGGSGGAIPGFAVPSIALGTAAAGGAAGTVIRSDATIVAFDATNPASSAPGDTVVVGTSAYAAHRDHRHAREAWIRPEMLHRTALVTNGAALTESNYFGQILAFYAWQNPGANGDIFTHSFVCAAGTYTFFVLGVTNATHGKIDWSIDGAAAFATGQDWYSAAQTFNVVQTVAAVVLTAGRHKLTGTVNGQNGASGGFYIVLTQYGFIPASD